MRIKVLKGLFVVFALAIIGRAIHLQVLGDPRLARMAERQFSSKLTALPRRGFIFDRNGEGLAVSLKVRSLFFRPEVAKKELPRQERTRIIFNVAKSLHMPIAQVASKMNSSKGFVWVKRQLSTHEEQSIRELGMLDMGDALGLAEETKRFYPNRDLGSHVLGSVNVDGLGLEGLELFYDGILNGERVRIQSNKDAMGRKIFRDDKGLLAYKDGQSLVLTIDKAMQYEAEKALRNSIEAYQAKAGTIIVAEVSTGEILAMANYPTFNPNNTKGVPADFRRNRAITDTYEPGSTFKPFLVGYAIEKGKSPKTKVYCENGSFRVGGHKISEAEAKEKFEWLTYGEIIKYSSNVGAAKIALDLGPQKMAELMNRLAIGHRTEIDLPGEASGSVKLNELSMQVRLANTGFGHGFTVTPLQMLTYYLSIANGGTWIQPKLVKAILAEDPDSLEKGAIRYRLGHRFDTLRVRKVFDSEIAKQLTSMLETVLEEKGTGVNAQLEEWPVAGKTGTAQKVDPDTHRYSRTKHIASFAGFAPSQSPKLVALVVIDEPQKHYYAGETAAPTFKEVMRSSLLREQVPPTDHHARIQQVANRSVIQNLGTDRPQKLSSAGPTPNPSSLAVNEHHQIRLPDLKGLTVRETLRALGEQPLDVEIIGSGILKEQIPGPEQWLEPKSKLRLVFHQPEQ